MSSFLLRFAHGDIVSKLLLLFKSADRNSESTNHHVAFVCNKLITSVQARPLFFQLCAFRVFDELLSNPIANASKSCVEIVQFAKYIVRSFVRLAQKVRVEPWFSAVVHSGIECSRGLKL